MHRAMAVAFVSSLLVILATARVKQGVYFDPATQLIAVQQRLAGESDSINRIIRPDVRDLSRDVDEWIVQWTPGTELFVYPLMRAGLSLGASVRIVAAAALTIGAVGWVTWFGQFALPPAILLVLAATWPFLRHASNGLFFYSAEMLVFAAAPWLLVLTARFLDRARTSPVRDAIGAIAVGLALGAAYWLKGSLGFVAAGALVAIAVWERHATASAIRWAAVVGLAAAGAAVPFFALSRINLAAGGSAGDQMSLIFRAPHVTWRHALDATALPALQMADAGSIWQYLLMHPARPIVGDSAWISALAVPGGLVLLWLLARPRVTSAAATVARSVLIVSLGLLVAVWVVSGVSHEPRHLTPAAFGFLPLAIAEARARWPSATLPQRRLLTAAAVFYICIPLAYGVVSVAQKVRRFPAGYRTGPARIYNALMSDSSVGGVREWLLARVTPADVWYMPEPISLLDLPGRAIITGADFESIDDVRAQKFTTTRPIRVNALLPSRFERNGKGQAVRASFPQAGLWTRTEIPQSDYALWTTDLRVAH